MIRKSLRMPHLTSPLHNVGRNISKRVVVAVVIFCSSVSLKAEVSTESVKPVEVSTPAASASAVPVSTPVIKVNPVAVATPVIPADAILSSPASGMITETSTADAPISLSTSARTVIQPNYSVSLSTNRIVVEKVTVDDAGTRLLVLVQTSKPVQCFVFERKDPPTLYIQFLTTGVYASGAPIQVVGIDPLTEIRYGYSNFKDMAVTKEDQDHPSPIDYLELKLTRSVFYHIQQQGWVVVVGLDRTTAKVEIPDLNFRFEPAKYEGAASLPDNPKDIDFIAVAQANSRLLTVAREEAELAKSRVWEAGRALYPTVTGRASAVRGHEVNPFPSENFAGFEETAFKRDEYGVQMTQPLYDSGRLTSAFKQAKLNRQMALENVRKQAQDLTYEVKKAYYTVLKNQAVLRIRRELVAQGEVLKNMVRQKAKLNLTSNSEVLNVSAQADQSSYQLTGDEQDLNLSRLVLISLLNQGKPVPDPIPGELTFGRLSFNVESIIGWAQEHRPDVRIAMLNTELARYNWKAAKADNSIKLDASGFYGRAGAAFAGDPFIMEPAWNFGVRASHSFWGNSVKGSFSKEETAPDLGQAYITDTQQELVEVGLLDGLPGQSAAKQAELQFQRAKAESVEASRKAEYEVRETYYNLEKASRQLEAVRQDVNFRQKDMEITREKVKLGLSELSQLMSAEVAYSQARVTEQDALSAYNIALSAMDRVAGAEVVRN